MLISIIIAVRDRWDQLKACIKSILVQTDGPPVEIFIIDDGSSDYTYEIAWSTIYDNHKKYPKISGKVIRHSINLGKIASLQTGVNRALGGLIAVVDSDSEWNEHTLSGLVDYKLTNQKKAVTGYTHPNGQGSEGNLYVTLASRI